METFRRFLILVLFVSIPAISQENTPVTELEAIQKIIDSHMGVVPLKMPLKMNETTSKRAILLVQGLEFSDPLETWAPPLKHLLSQNHTLYFFKWSKFKSLQFNRKKLREAYLKLLKTHQEIDVVGYSAGGVISLLALDMLVGTPFYSRLHLRTVATPFFGYAAPRIAYMGAPFAGISAIQIGVGARRFLRNSRLDGCQQWITTECQLDQHACLNKGISPLRGRFIDPPEMPCGNQNLTLLPLDTHGSSLYTVIQKEFP